MREANSLSVLALTAGEKNAFIRNQSIEIAGQCLSECLAMLNTLFDTVLDVRMSMFCKLAYERDDIWHVAPISQSTFLLDETVAIRPLELTQTGEDEFRKLFSGKMASLDFVQVAKERFLHIATSYVLNNDHTLCDKALTIIRRQYSQVSELMDNLAGMLVIYDSHHVLVYNKLR